MRKPCGLFHLSFYLDNSIKKTFTALFVEIWNYIYNEYSTFLVTIYIFSIFKAGFKTSYYSEDDWLQLKQVFSN